MAHIPLFQKNLILRTIGEVNPLPDPHLKILRKWQASLRSGSLKKIKEISLHGQFLTDLFGHVLGYAGITDGHGENGEWQYGVLLNAEMRPPRLSSEEEELHELLLPGRNL